ncbi:MAG: AAA family ATPase [Dehalococcoidia bacterium]
MAKVVAIVGMNGSGKSEVTRIFEQKGYARIRFGDITDEEIRKRGLELNEANERRIREELRKGDMAAYAELNRPKIELALKDSKVVIDGLYSWDEYKILKQHYGNDLIVIAVYASPKTRQQRLPHREVRPLNPEDSSARDYNEIEHLQKGGPIAIADYTLINEHISIEELRSKTEQLITDLDNVTRATPQRR